MDHRAARHLPVARLTLRPLGPGDEAFEASLFDGPLPALQRAAQRREFLGRFPGSSPDVVCLDGEPVGRVWVWRAAGAILLVDLALAAEHRGRGLGTALLRGLLAEGKTVSLSVTVTNLRARRLYERLGFRVIRRGDTHVHLAAAPAPSGGGPPGSVAV